jgi:tetratricopeptide (TPR) repeat protein
MRISKITLLIIIVCFTTSLVFGQTEAMKDVVNNLAFFYQKKDYKFLNDAKKSVDASFKTHADSLNVDRNVYKALVYSSILYADSLNKLNQPDTLLLQTTKLVNWLQKSRKIYKYDVEMNYIKGCVANVYLRKAFADYSINNYQPAINNFKIAKAYVPAAKQINSYLAHLYFNMGNYPMAVGYYDTLMRAERPKLEYVETATSIYKAIGDTVKALNAIKKGLEINPNDKFLLFEEANIYNNQHQYVPLSTLLDKLIVMQPENQNLTFLAANCYDQLNKFDQAEHYYLKTIEINNSDYYPVFNLGLLYLRQATLNLKNAEQYQVNILRSKNWLEKANEIDPNNEKCLKALQLLYLQTNNTSRLNIINNKLNQLNN